MRKAVMALVTALTLAAGGLTPVAVADDETDRHDATDRIYDQHIQYGARGIRYPGDVATPVGNYHVRGGRKIPYIERCHWTFEINDLGLPWHFKQVCRRYYGKPIN